MRGIVSGHVEDDPPAVEVVVFPSPAKELIGVAVDLVELLSPHRRHSNHNPGVRQSEI